MTHEFILVIPARYNSTRLPGKPLIDIAGKIMIQRVYEQCLKAVESSKIFIATDDNRIREKCEEFGAQVVMTSANCLTGTDRVAEISSIISAKYYINIQGDEPLFNPSDIVAMIGELKSLEEDCVLVGYCPILSREEFESPYIPKAVFSKENLLLYMSRSPIPGNKSGKFSKAWRQVCAYAFTKSTLSLFGLNKSKSVLEEIEDIETLRFLENGVSVRGVAMSSDSIAVDCPEDIEKIKNRLNNATL